MSKYLSKKAVLESIGEAYQTNLESPDQTDWDEGYRSALRFMERTVLSGAFDADTSEIQRLRNVISELEERAKMLQDDWELDGYNELVFAITKLKSIGRDDNDEI